MRGAIIAWITLALLLLVTDNAFAAQFAFDPHSATGVKNQASLVPAAVVAMAFLLGTILIIMERR
jgi:hypothetical protein